MPITWKRTVLSRIDGIYCVEVFHKGPDIKIAAASELHGGICKMIDFKTREEELVWSGPGGCMNVAQWSDEGDLIGVQNFYKGAQALDAQVVWAAKGGNGWETRVLAKLPYLHHCGVVRQKKGSCIIASTLCTKREFPGDWSHPGAIQVFAKPEQEEAAKIRIIREGVVKNHGFWQGTFDNEEVILISGHELYRVKGPEEEHEQWKVDTIIGRELSDIAVQDIDGDGEDEILAFEGLHGNLATINKRINGKWEVIYSCPMKFAHGIWGGKLLGKPSFVIGSMQGEGELSLLLGKREGRGFTIKRTVIETGIGPSNVRGFSFDGRSYVLAAAREAGELVLFELEEKEY